MDTEGFDATIVHSLLDAVHSKPSLRPDHIKYEHIALDDSVRTTLQSRLASQGCYDEGRGHLVLQQAAGGGARQRVSKLL